MNGTWPWWAVPVLLVIGAVAFVVVHDETMALECKRGGVPFMQALFKEWLVENWTESKRPNDPTAIPDGTSPARIDVIGYTNTYYPAGTMFFADVPNGAAFEVRFDRFCGSRILDRQPCPKRKCPMLKRLMW